ncbi:hypothetical protein FB451DRAFT_1565385 [Mycena latifolia]|nr:hypothetical protein FB451DRAFT_1565385 [Mycena latifolia]
MSKKNNNSGYESDTGARDNPSCWHFEKNRTVEKKIVVQTGHHVRLLNHEGRAICRIMNACGWSVVKIAIIFGISQKPVSRAVSNSYTPPDDPTMDYAHVDPEFRIKFPPVKSSQLAKVNTHDTRRTIIIRILQPSPTVIEILDSDDEQDTKEGILSPVPGDPMTGTTAPTTSTSGRPMRTAKAQFLEFMQKSHDLHTSEEPVDGSTSPQDADDASGSMAAAVNSSLNQRQIQYSPPVASPSHKTTGPIPPLPMRKTASIFANFSSMPGGHPSATDSRTAKPESSSVTAASPDPRQATQTFPPQKGKPSQSNGNNIRSLFGNSDAETPRLTPAPTPGSSNRAAQKRPHDVAIGSVPPSTPESTSASSASAAKKPRYLPPRNYFAPVYPHHDSQSTDRTSQSQMSQSPPAQRPLPPKPMGAPLPFPREALRARRALAEAELDAFLADVAGADLSAHRALFLAQGFDMGMLRVVAGWEPADVDRAVYPMLQDGGSELDGRRGLSRLQVLSLKIALERLGKEE